jgi:Co/Zn/Cd efflux system component
MDGAESAPMVCKKVQIQESFMNHHDSVLRRAVLLVALLNLGYFGVEFGVALHIGSVSLFADSVDFLEDTAVNVLIFVALGWSMHRRSRVGISLAVILLVPGASTLWTAWQKFNAPVAPNASLLSVTGAGALCVNLFCAFLLMKFRKHSGSLTRAAFLSARNDALANIAIIGAGLVTAATISAWPDLLVGLGIFLMNLDAAREVLSAAKQERMAESMGAQPA